MIGIALHLFLLLVFPPFLYGVINRTKAIFAGRKGVPLFQLFLDIAKLFRKGMVISVTTTAIFQLAPVITLASVLAAGMLVPIGNTVALVSFTGDFILFTYLFALSRFCTTSAALDTGSAFEGMGVSREITFALFGEPSLFFAFLVLSRFSSSLSLSGMFHSGIAHAYPSGSVAPLVMTAIGLFVFFLAENSRIPVDDPNTHLELTMIHEVMVLDHSGPLLGLIEYASAVKLFVLGSLLVNVCIPHYTGQPFVDWSLFIAGMLLLAVITGIVESMMARLRMNRVPSLLIASILLCGSAFVMILR